MRRFALVLFRSFLQGLILLSPIAITVLVIYKVFESVDNLVPSMPRGIGFLMIISIVTTVGYLGTRFFIGKWLFESFGYVMKHTPGIKYIYSSVNDIISSFVGDKKKFNLPVWVNTQRDPEIWRIGFMTQKDMNHYGINIGDKVAVYLPHSYAISGWVIVVDRKCVKPVEGMNAGEAMKFAVSGGVTNSVEDKKK
jgi:uncharacterized membrane protein